MHCCRDSIGVLECGPYLWQSFRGFEMIERKPIFPNIIELNHQAGHVIGCNVYLVYDGDDWLLIDIGYEDDVEEIIELIREMDFSFSNCKTLIATHADVDHIQGLAKAKQILRTTVTAHPLAAEPLKSGDPIKIMEDGTVEVG